MRSFVYETRDEEEMRTRAVIIRTDNNFFNFLQRDCVQFFEHADLNLIIISSSQKRAHPFLNCAMHANFIRISILVSLYVLTRKYRNIGKCTKHDSEYLPYSKPLETKSEKKRDSYSVHVGDIQLDNCAR